MTIPFDERSRTIPGIVIDLIGQFTTLLRQESQLARAEISENLNRALTGVVMAVAAAVLLIPALVILLLAGVYGLEAAGFAPYWSALIVGGAAVVVGAVLMLIGINRLKAKNLIPSKTIHQLQEDAALAKRQMNSEQEGTDGFQRAA
ncbi:MAG TPA: phage holin family protein [Pseudolabrys sp.]|nr:phage holin family protein [Pseudolabrys sp.]